MSAAAPMDWMDRAEHYAAHPDQLTPRQTRRLWHKEGRADPGYVSVDEDIPAAERPKGHTTPRQRKQRPHRA